MATKKAKHSAKKSARAAAKTSKKTAARTTATTVRTSGFESVKKSRSKSQVLKELSISTGLSKREVSNLFENLTALMRNDLLKGPGIFQLPGLLKVMVVKKKAVPARKGLNPFTGQEMTFKAKPARNVVRARPLKGLKDMVKKS